jgi:hypothetical protein
MRKLVGGLAAFSLFALAAAPAEARHRHRDRNDVDAGDVVAGALVVGAIAALVSSNGNAKHDAAVDMCSAEAERRLSAPITTILNVGKRKGYYTVDGAVEQDDGTPIHFSCTVRRGVLYSFFRGPNEA